MALEKLDIQGAWWIERSGGHVGAVALKIVADDMALVHSDQKPTLLAIGAVALSPYRLHPEFIHPLVIPPFTATEDGDLFEKGDRFQGETINGTNDPTVFWLMERMCAADEGRMPSLKPGPISDDIMQ